MPQEFVEYRESWSRLHPGWDMRLWTEENLPTDLARKEAYERLRKPAERADIIRLEVLLRFGGVYVDTDLECLRSIEPLLEEVEFCTASIKPGRVSNTFIGASAAHPILERGVKELRPRTEYGLDKSATGPFFFNKLIRDYPEVTIFPTEFFYPATPEERARAYAVHHFARSWQEPEDLRRALRKSELQLADARERIEKLEGRRLSNRASRLAERFRGVRGQSLR
jgi:mannosyltransferase OCH1-like enzyme